MYQVLALVRHLYLRELIKELDSEYPIAVVEGGQHTDLDAERIRKTGIEAYQINTGKACHLDAHWSCF
ncbi:GTP-binding protein [Francisella-like endosymbiont]|uniref:GTP-binding protein n=1 Tax=Francisella-like endosymbiont TaxID=512373 RepID=UPI00296F2EFD